MVKLIIEPGRIEKNYWRDLWRFRELFLFLAWRDILVRYKQTVIGIAWAVLRPLLLMLVFTVVFNRIARLPSSGNTPYAILVFAALLPWQFFATAVTECSNSLVNNSNLISKVYFPRLIVPSGTVITSLVDFLISFVLLLGVMAWYQYGPDWHLLTLPLFALLGSGVAMAFGIWFSALTVRYRDVRYVVPFLAQIGMYVSPVGFSSSLVPEKWRLLYSLNPMVGVIDGFRWAIMRGETPLYWPGLLVSVVLMLVVGVSGIHYFRRTEKSFADVI
ncbi:MAG: ABC transporter permease [Akkermansiaceae bacterium]|nr:ABC transporter permease [Verrucomicrobiales bacterium]